jgi:hypothetical protein
MVTIVGSGDRDNVAVRASFAGQVSMSLTDLKIKSRSYFRQDR